MRRVSIIILLMMFSIGAHCTPAYPYPIEITQPDGSKLMILIRGDEHTRYRTSIMGDRLVMDSKGYYRPTFAAPQSRMSRARITPLAGESVSALIIPVQFSDCTFQVEKPQEHFDNMLNKKGYSEFDATGSVRDYFEDNLMGKKSLLFTVSKVVTMDYGMKYYGGGNDEKGGEMVREACRKVNDEIDFSKYNYVFVFYAGYSEAEGGDVNSLWPASLDFSNNPITYDGASIKSVGYASELKGSTGKTPSGIGAFCHEFGHILGLPDLYDADYEENGRAKGMWGTLALMDYGCYNNQGRTPPYFNAVEREILGAKGERLITNDVHNLEPVNVNGRFFRVDTQTDGEYFLIESRTEKGWDAYIGGSGLLIYHIDKSSNPAGMITASVRWDNNLINTCAEHECADLVEAIQSAVNVKQVFFPGLGNVTSFATLTVPHFVGWDMRGVGIKLVDIKLNSDEEGVSFLAKVDNDEILLDAIDVSAKCDQTTARISWKQTTRMDARWGVRWRIEGEDYRESDEKISNDTKCYLENLKAGQNYECQLYHIGYRSNGDTTAIKFQTVGTTSPFPYIYGLDKSVEIGDTLYLKIYNLNEVDEYVKWYLDGVEVKDGVYTFVRSGECLIEAKIKYLQDGSVETIRKSVVVIENKSEYEQDVA